MMGTGTPVKLNAVDITMTPVLRRILKLCYGYLPESPQRRYSWNRDHHCRQLSTRYGKTQRLLLLRWLAGSVALMMQEPVAAVMCVMKRRKGDGVFLVFDLGGGTPRYCYCVLCIVCRETIELGDLLMQR